MNKLSVHVRDGAVWLNSCWKKHLCYFKKKIDTVRSEYGEIINASEVSNVIYEIYDVWNKSDN